MENGNFLEVRNICKQFNGISVLKDVALQIRSGEVHALMGENGAGKSTMIKIITGVYTKDAGEILIHGEPVKITCSHDAASLGIAAIYQDLSLIPALTIAENIYLGHELTRYGKLSKRQMNKNVQELINKYGFHLEPDVRVESLGMAKRQMVEILKALSMDAKLIIMDEPTAALSSSETEKLFETIEGLQKKGTAVLYVSHRLNEVYRIADRLTVMRDGKNVGVLEKSQINPALVTKMTIGHEIKQASARVNPVIHQDICLQVKNLAYKNILRDVNFTAFGGEVLGISGLIGSGRTELIKCIYGAFKVDVGTIMLSGKPVSKSVGKNIRAGFGYVPEDRRREGFAPVLSIAKNVVISSYDKLATGGFVHTRKENECAEKTIKDYDIRPAIKYLPVGNLSGGNQQKTILARWLSRAPKLLLLDEPTAGVDVGVKAELYNYIWKLADTGAIVIVVSSDLVELTYLSDRILVMYDGRFFEEFDHEHATQAAILMASSGTHTEEGKAL